MNVIIIKWWMTKPQKTIENHFFVRNTIGNQSLKCHTVECILRYINKRLQIASNIYHCHRKDRLTHWGRDKMTAIFQTTFSNAFLLIKMYKLQLKFHCNFFPIVQLIIFQHWFGQWLGAVQATSHYLNQWWLVYWHIYVTRPQWINIWSLYVYAKHIWKKNKLTEK